MQLPRATHNLMLVKKEFKSDEPGILQVFKMKSTSKLRKNAVPLIFLAIPKKGAPATYYKYEDLKESHPQFILDFFEKRMTAKTSIEIAQQAQKEKNIVSLPQQKKQKREESPDKKGTKDRKEVKQPIKEKEKEKEKQKEVPVVKFMHERQYYKESISKEREQRELNAMQPSKGMKDQNQSRPVRSCRYRTNFRSRDDFEREEIRESFNRNFDEQDMHSQVQDERQQENDEEEYRRKSYKKIIDYDGMILQQEKFEFVSPAVIPTSKSRADAAMLTYTLPPRVTFKDTERDQFSSEEFKESEESEFVLDDRGKQKRRRERMMREQERLNKKRKTKKLKKKKKAGARP